MKIFIIILFSFHTLAFSLKVGYYDVPPHAQTVKGKRTGPAIKYFERFFSKNGINVSWVNIPMARIEGMIKSKSIDIILGQNITKEREEFLSYIKPPIYKADFVLSTKKTNQKNYKDFIRMGKNIAVVKGHIIPNKINDWFSIKQITGKKSFERLIKLILQDRVEVGLHRDHFVMNYVLRKKNLDKALDVHIIPQNDLGIDVSTYIAYRKDLDKKIVEKLSKDWKKYHLMKSYDAYIREVLK